MNPPVATTYSVEGLTVRGWELWGVTEDGRSLNPCTSLWEARTLRGELDLFRATSKTGYTGSRIIETTVTRREVTDLESAQAVPPKR
jgi:hypothetical protein